MTTKAQQYVTTLIPLDEFKKTPKSVYANIAASFALLLSEGDWDKANQLIKDEWATLYDNGIVPQNPKV